LLYANFLGIDGKFITNFNEEICKEIMTAINSSTREIPDNL